jgi:Ras-related protein Rab-1A
MPGGGQPVSKLVLIGDSDVGKSSLLLRFSDGVYRDAYAATIGVDFRFKTVTVGGAPVKLQIWDTAGQERFRNITSSYYRNADGVILCFDVGQRSSFENVRAWLAELDKNASADLQKLLVGNKSDREDRQVSREEGLALAEELGVPFLETSAKSADNVEAAFVRLAELVVRVRDRQREEERQAVVDLARQQETAKAAREGGGCGAC